MSVNSIYIPTEVEYSDNNKFLYSMEINCQSKLYKDKSINGTPQSTNNWQSSNGDLLIDETIRIVCLYK